jgi:hypothetical protein
MQMDVSLDAIQLRRLQRNLAKMPEAIGITVQWLTWDQGRLAGRDAIKGTAPWAGNSSGNTSRQRKVGEGAVEGDINRAFAEADEDKYTFFVNKGNGKRYAKNKATNQTFEIPPDLWMPELKARHLKLRNSKGRVMKQSRQAWAKPKDLRNYIKTVQSRVGSLKASWVPAAQYFARRVNGALKIPAWVSRHVPQGTFIDAVAANGNGQIVLSSTIDHNTAIRRSLMPFIAKERDKYLRRITPKRMQQIADQFNAGRTALPIRERAA